MPAPALVVKNATAIKHPTVNRNTEVSDLGINPFSDFHSRETARADVRDFEQVMQAQSPRHKRGNGSTGKRGDLPSVRFAGLMLKQVVLANL